MLGRDWPFWVCFTVAAICLIPSVWLLGKLYLSSPRSAKVIDRDLSVGISGLGRKRGLSHRMKVRLMLAGEAQQREWSQQLPLEHPLEALEFFDGYAPGHEVPVWLATNGHDIYLQRGLPEGRFGLGLGLGIFGLGFLFFALLYGVPRPDGRPFQNTGVLIALAFGLLPMTFGAWFGWQLYQRYYHWNRVEAKSTEFKPLDLYNARAPEVSLDAEAKAFLDGATMNAVEFTHAGKQYLARQSRTLSCYDCLLASNPVRPTVLADIPQKTLESLAGALLPLGFGLFFTLLSLIGLAFR